MAEANSTGHAEMEAAPVYFDRPAFMRDELTNDLLEAGIHVSQAERIGDIHIGLHCIESLVGLSKRFAMEDASAADGAAKVTCLSPNGSDLLAKSVELIAMHLASQAVDFAQTLIKDEKRRSTRAGSDFEARR